MALKVAGDGLQPASEITLHGAELGDMGDKLPALVGELRATAYFRALIPRSAGSTNAGS